MSEGKLQTEKYIIGYIDLLGSEEKILGDDSDYWLNAVNTLYNDAWEYAYLLGLFIPGAYPFIIVFSDNILIAEKLNPEDEYMSNRFYRLLYFMSYIQSHALTDYNWLARGGLTVGDLYVHDPPKEVSESTVTMSKSFIWGKGLLRVYALEENIAVYPRIIIDHCVYTTKEGNMCSILNDERFALKDIDGLSYLNYLEVDLEANHSYDGKRDTIISQSFDALSKILDESKGNDSVSQKVEWTRNYLNLVKSDTEYLKNSSGLINYLDEWRFRGKK